MVIERGVILAAGRGTRLGPLTDDTPKPMLEIGGAPLIDHIVTSMVAVGVRALTVVTGYLGSAIERHLAASSPVPVAFVRQQHRNGTGGALRLVESAIAYEPFMLGWGDIATDRDHYLAVAGAWRPQLAGVIGVNMLEDVSSGSSVVFGDDLIVTSIVEKPEGESASQWNSAGVMVFGSQIWAHLETLQPSARGELELPDAVNSMLAAGEQLKAVPLRGGWHDIGTPDALQAARSTD